jgi:hypothetical protein
MVTSDQVWVAGLVGGRHGRMACHLGAPITCHGLHGTRLHLAPADGALHVVWSLNDRDGCKVHDSHLFGYARTHYDPASAFLASSHPVDDAVDKHRHRNWICWVPRFVGKIISFTKTIKELSGTLDKS